MIRAILDGAEAVRKGGEIYLPKFPAETDSEYKRRLCSAPWRPEFEDIQRGIVSKPFAKEVTLAGKPSDEMKAIAEDVDGRGNNLHVFAKTSFEYGVDFGAAGILVDFPTMEPGATKADERANNARPYWVCVAADEIISLRTERRGAREIVTHLRMWETATISDGFVETIVKKIRVIEPGLWELWHEVKNESGATEWDIEARGAMTLDEVPFVFYATAERKGSQYVRPPLLDLANMQIELYRKLSNKDEIYTAAAAPMLTANGMSAPTDGSSVEVGPRRVLYAPGADGVTTSWAYVQPEAANLKEIRDDCVATIEDMRRLGMQPMLPKTGNVTATASGIEAAKGHTAIGTWANGLKDALEQAFMFTSKWLHLTEQVEVQVSTDFSVGMYGAEEVTALVNMRDKKMISEKTLWDEMMRRGVLGPQFDADKEVQQLVKEMPGDDELGDGRNDHSPAPQLGA
jgi:hypothetical protein